MKTGEWEEVVTDFIETVETSVDFEEIDLEKFLIEGLNPLLEDYLALKKASQDLAEHNLNMFKTVVTKPSNKMKNSKFFNCLSLVMKLTTESENLQ